LVAGVGTLLLAMGVGVLIGHDTSNRAAPSASTQPVHITVQAGAGSGAAASTPTIATAVKASSGSGSKAAVRSSKASAKARAAVNSNASNAAAKVLGGNHIAPPTVTVGAKGHGAGYQNGHFTGNFFGN
jgi:hypothetical protein